MKGMNHGKGTGSVYKKIDDGKGVTLYSTLPKDQQEAAKKWNLKTYGTLNPTSEADKRGITKDELAKFHKSNADFEKDFRGDKENKNLQDYEIPQGEYTAEKPYEAADIGKNRQVGLFNPVTPRFDYSKIDYGRGGKPRTEWKKHTTEELAKIIKDKPHRFGGFDPVKDADRMNEILRPSKLTYADKYGKSKKLVRYEYGDSVRFHGFSDEEKKNMQSRQKKRRDWHQSHKDQYIKGTSDKKPNAQKPIEFPKSSFHPPKAQTWTGKNPMKKSPLKFGRKYKK